jgi:hypothetical protein
MDLPATMFGVGKLAKPCGRLTSRLKVGRRLDSESHSLEKSFLELSLYISLRFSDKVQSGLVSLLGWSTA